ncbi:MAG: MFS transporter [Acidobacteriota bacterium]|nr:MFS transporter [Acidobacteriota bacterium]
MATAPLPTGFSSVTRDQWRTLGAAALGWMLDAFDVMLYALVLTHIMRDLGMTKAMGGLLATLTLLASGFGGMLFGSIADRVGRKRALMLSILTYSVCSFASGFATSVAMLAVFRFVLGLGMGGEWNTGATLVAETWPTQLRAKAISLVQSSWALGYAAAALVAWGVLRLYPANWRAVFFVGVLPALVTLWIRKDVPESEMWKQQRLPQLDAEQPPPVGFSELFAKKYRGKTAALFFLNFFGMFGWWGLFTWVPSFLSSPIADGGRGFDPKQMTIMLVVLNLVGMLPGYASFGWVADRLGRRKSFILYTVMAALLVPIYARLQDPTTLLLLGIPVAFFGTGFFSGSGIVGSELFPTSVRARALGFTYNGARTLSSVAPFVIGYVAQSRGLGGAFLLCAASFFLAALVATQLPETKGKHLE